jgi:hypothetical protein
VGGLIAVSYVNYLPVYILLLAGVTLLSFLLIRLVRRLYPLEGLAKELAGNSDSTVPPSSHSVS